jgi:type I restriction enzyme, S subunit
MSFAGFKNARVVRSSWLEEGGRRLDCNPYMSGALEARDALKLLSAPKEKLSAVTSRIFHAGREGRLWVDDPSYGVPFLGSSDILSADLWNLPLMSKKQIERNPLFTLAEGWTLITRSGTIGRMAYARPNMAGIACSEHVLRVVPNTSRIPSGYLYAFLSSRYGVPLVVSGTYGAIIQHIEPEHISDLPVPRFANDFERRISSLIEDAALQRVIASEKRREAIDLFQRSINWSGLKNPPLASVALASGTLRRMDAFHHSSKVLSSVATLAEESNVPLSDRVERVFEPNRGSRLKVTDPDYGVPFLSSSSVFDLNPTGEYFISRSLTPHVGALLLSSCDVLLPRSGQIGGIIGRAVLPLGQNIGHAGSEHLVRVRCRSESDAAYLWAVLASEPGYWALVGTAFGTSIPSLDAGLISGLRLPWLDAGMRREIALLVRKAVGAQDKGIELENAAIQEVEAKIREQA